MGMIPRSAVAGRFFLDVGGVKAGFLQSVEGGDAVAEVVTERAAAKALSRKHLGPVHFEPIELRFGLGLAPDVYAWIDASWRPQAPRKDGSIVAVDFDGVARSARDFKQALVSETTIPALDAASKEVALLTVKIAPGAVQRRKASGKVSGPASPAQKQWLASNFKLDIGGLDCTKVAKIDALTIRRTERGVEIPNVRVTLAAASVATWQAWFDDFVVKGANDQSKERKGSISFLAPDLKVLGRVELLQLGIFALREPQPRPNEVARVVAELYCEEMRLEVSP